MTALKFLVGVTERLYGRYELMSTSLIFLSEVLSELSRRASDSGCYTNIALIHRFERNSLNDRIITQGL
jgi:hypothetical protein